MDRDPGANVNLLDFILGNAYLQLGRYDEVRKLLETRGARLSLRDALVALENRDPELTAGIVPPTFRMEVLMMMGERERALEVLEGYVVQPPLTAMANLFWPWADPIRTEPRVQAVLAQMGLSGVEPVRSPPIDESGTP